MIENIPLPRLLNASGNTERTISPISVSVNCEIVPLSYASMQLPQGENLPARSYVELFTCMGSAGIFRVRSPQDAYGSNVTTAELEHAVVEVGDYLVLNEYSEMMAASTAMQTVFTHYKGSKWQLGSVTALGSGQIALEANHNRVLEAMLAILDQKPDCMMAFDFSTSPWTINIVARGTTVTAEGRLARNLNYARVTYDDTELCTRAWYEYQTVDDEGEAISVWAHVDADTMSSFGMIEREVQTGSNYTQSEALRIANAYIARHKVPRITVETSLDELSSVTGEEYDAFEIGKLCRLALDDYGVSIEQHITGLSFPDVYGDPRNITARLAEEEDTAITFLHDLDTYGSSGGGGGGGKKIDDAWKEFRTRFYQTDHNIGLTAERVNHANDILEAAGIDVSVETGVLIYDYDVENGIGAMLNVTKEEIRSEVYASNSQIYSSISQTASQIRLEVTDELSGMYSSITQTAGEIRSEVRSSMSAFYTAIIQSISGVAIRTGESTRTFHQPDAPTGTEEDPLVDGDLWFDAAGQFRWEDAEGKTWLEDTDFDWGSLVSADMYRYNGSTEDWVKIIDERAVMQDSRFEVTKAGISNVAARVDRVEGETRTYRSEFNATADGIKANMESYHNQLSSNIQATAESLKSDYVDRINGTESHITQTASQIRAEVASTKSELQSSITVEANRISLVVEGTGANAKIKPAQIVAAINNGASSILISANHVNLDGYVTASSLVAAFQDINTASINHLAVPGGNGSMTLLGYTTTWQSYNARRVTVSDSHSFRYETSGGASYGTVSGRIVTGYSDTTLYYLGHPAT